MVIFHKQITHDFLEKYSSLLLKHKDLEDHTSTSTTLAQLPLSAKA